MKGLYYVQLYADSVNFNQQVHKQKQRNGKRRKRFEEKSGTEKEKHAPKSLSFNATYISLFRTYACNNNTQSILFNGDGVSLYLSCSTGGLHLHLDP